MEGTRGEKERLDWWNYILIKVKEYEAYHGSRGIKNIVF